ncbi:cell division protein FtsQ/DivIB [Pseudooceanicola aestuarii]|uniref:cell division protein FtsQ/DivIB n=1 Tax=Pseudooceanicola aestuarii TaxID=2697319 RepID=UPI0013D2102C|nr:cell division protein FtsQ/DivIB [Pseudooceanicola aestuarii]
MRKVRRERSADPAPSRWSYRLQRMMLTPGYRLALRIILPAAVSAGAVFGYMANDARRDAVVLQIAEWRSAFETRPEFMVNSMAIEGATAETQQDIREVTQLDLPMTSFDLDLDGMRATIEDLAAVASTSLQLRQGGVLQVTVRERIPVAIWRGRDGLFLVDEEGVVTGALSSRGQRPDLPLLAGEGKPHNVGEALALHRAAGPIGDRLRGMVRMGDRRWDVVLDRGQRILLPEDNPVQALERVIAIDGVHELLARDLAAVDMRLTRRPTIRMNEAAVEKWWQIKDLVVETD